MSEDPHDREMGYLLLFSLHEVISSYISLSDLINVLHNGLNDPDFSVGFEQWNRLQVLSMAVKASCDIITTKIDDETITYYTPLLPRLLQILQSSLASGEQELVLRIVGLFDDAAISSPPFFGDHLESVLSACCSVVPFPPLHSQILANDALSYNERCAACMALGSVLSEYNVEVTAKVPPFPRFSRAEPPRARTLRRFSQHQRGRRPGSFPVSPIMGSRKAARATHRAGRASRFWTRSRTISARRRCWRR